jgi:NAD(P)-dependent dehydrogenase (short-subunit alcohol dehydrogenase family)
MSNLTVDLQGRVVVVTGAFGALGAAVAASLRGCGAKVAEVDHAPAPVGKTSGDLVFGGRDLSDAQIADALMAEVNRSAGRLDGLVNIAGGFLWEKIDGGSLDTWDAMYRMNLRTCVAACSAALPHLVSSGHGRIINIGALGAVKAATGMAAYAASKAGVAKLTESLAEELKDRGVTVNAILPSIIDTPRNRADMPGSEFDRWVEPAALGKVIAFLLSDAAAIVTGALIPVAGRV